MAGRRRAACCSTCSARPRRCCWSSPGACATAPPTSSPRRPTSPRTLAGTWGAGRWRAAAFPRLHLAFDRLLAHTDAPAWTVTTAPEGPDVATVAAAGWAPVVGDGDALVKPAARAARRRLPRGASPPTATARPPGSRRCSADEGLHLARRAASRPDQPGGHVVVAPLERGFLLPVGQAGRAGRGRRDRPAPGPPPGPPAPPRAPRASSTTSSPATTSCTTSTASPATAAWSSGPSAASSATTCCSSTAATTSSTCRPTRSTPCATTPAARRRRLSRLGGGDWQKTKATRPLGGAPRSPRSSSCSTRSACTRRGPRLRRPTRRGSTSWRTSFPYEDTPDQRQGHRRGQGATWRRPSPMDRLVCGDVGFGKTEVAHPGRVQGGAGRQAGRGARAHHAAGPAALPDLQRPLRRLPGAGRGAQPLPHQRARPSKVVDGLATGEVDVVIGTHRLLSRRRRVQGPRAARGRRGAALRRQPQGGDQAAAGRRRRAHADGHADPAHAGDEPHRHPRPDAAQHAAGRPPADPHLRRRVRRPGRRPRRSGASCCARARSSSCTTACRTSRRWPPRCASLVPEARIAVAHGQMDEGTLEQVVHRLLGGRVRRARVHDDHRVGHRHAHGQHARRRPRRPARPRPAPPAARPRRPGRLSGPTPTSSTRPTSSLTEEAYERLKTIGEATELGSGFKIAMRDLEIRGAGNLLGTGQSGHIAAVGYDLYCQMVTEAVAELKGEEVRRAGRDQARAAPRRQPAPSTTWPRRSSRLEAYRRLAAVTTEAEVDDIRAEWEDRYGPVPPPAEALLEVARPAGRVRPHRRPRGHGHQGARVRWPPLHRPAHARWS